MLAANPTRGNKQGFCDFTAVIPHDVANFIVSQAHVRDSGVMSCGHIHYVHMYMPKIAHAFCLYVV